MVVNPYKANDGRQRIAEPYYSSSGHPGTQRSLLFGVLSTRNMIILLLAAIAVVSYIFHIHHTFVEDGNASSVQGSSKLRGSVSSTIDNIKNRLTAQPSLVPTWHPTRKPTFVSTAATTSPRPTFSPTTVQPTATPTPLPTSVSVSETSVTDAQQQPDGIDQAESASNSVSQPSATSQVIPSIANDNKDELTSISEVPVNSKDGDGLNEHNDNARAAYLSLLESMKKRPTIGRPGPSHVSEKISDAATHDKEKEQFFPPNRKPDVLPPNFEGKSLQVPPQKATASDGMIPFVAEAKPNQIQRLSPPGEEDTSSTSVDTTMAEGQTPVRMKFDLPSNVQLQSKSRDLDPTTSAQSTDKVDHCKLQSDPFQSQPIESFVPPTSAPFAKVLEWQTEVKSVLKNIGKMRIGGDKLRQHLQEEVTRLRIKRFNTFCEYL